MSDALDSAEGRLARKRSLSRRGFAYRLLGAVALILLTLEIGQRPGLEVPEILSGLAAVVAGIGAMEAGIRAYRLNLGTQKRPKISVSSLPAETSLAFAPLVRLASRERELAEHVSGLPPEVAADTWRSASAAAKALRSHAARITVLERRTGADAPDGAELLASRLREGVSAYERLTVTAAELSAHDGEGTPSPNAALRLADATDALVGMTRGLGS